MATNVPEENGEESSFLPEEKPVLDQLLNFVEFKENVSYISEKVTGIKNEIWSDVEIGYSFNECESLLEKQDQLELKCADIYSSFSLLRQEATDAVRKNNSFSKHYRKSCQFLENMCYSLASDLVTRRDLVTSSAKFHSFLLQFRNEIEDVKIFVTAFEEVEDFNIDMDFILKKVHVFIDQICNLAGAVISQGIQLFEIFSKLKVPFRIQEIHRQHVGGWIAFAEVEREFHLKKLDGLVLRIELLWQMKRCHKGVKQSIQWLQELIATVISRSNEVGESAMEADTLFLQLIQCKDAAEESYEIGEKLLQSSFELKKKLNFKNYKSELQKELDEQWKEFSDAFNGVAERLNLSQSFYRSIEKQMNKIEELKATIQSKLKTFGEIRRSFVIQRFKKTWTRIYSAIQKTLHTGRCLLDALKRPVTPNHKVLSFFAEYELGTAGLECRRSKSDVVSSTLNEFWNF